MALQVLRAGLDTVEISYAGEINQEVASALDSLKEHAQATDAPQPYSLGLLDFQVQPTAFRMWRRGNGGWLSQYR